VPERLILIVFEMRLYRKSGDTEKTFDKHLVIIRSSATSVLFTVDSRLASCPACSRHLLLQSLIS